MGLFSTMHGRLKPQGARHPSVCVCVCVSKWTKNRCAHITMLILLLAGIGTRFDPPHIYVLSIEFELFSRG